MIALKQWDQNQRLGFESAEVCGNIYYSEYVSLSYCSLVVGWTGSGFGLWSSPLPSLFKAKSLRQHSHVERWFFSRLSQKISSAKDTAGEVLLFDIMLLAMTAVTFGAIHRWWLWHSPSSLGLDRINTRLWDFSIVNQLYRMSTSRACRVIQPACCVPFVATKTTGNRPFLKQVRHVC